MNKNCALMMVMIGSVLVVPVFAAPMDKDKQDSERAWAQVDRVGPPNQNFIDVERFRFGTTDMSNPDFYPVPQDKITRDTYMRAIDAANPRALAARIAVITAPRLHMVSSTLGIPALAHS